MKPTITWEDFEKIDMRSGTIIAAKPFPEAKKSAYILHIDFGLDIGVKKSSAQITDQYTLEDLIGKKIIAVVNFTPKQIGPFMSECLICGLYTKQGISLPFVNQQVENGSSLG